jgi:hypothetical protein
MAAPSTQVPPARSRESTKAGSNVGVFNKMEEIGRGSFATVYKAMHVVRDLPPKMANLHLPSHLTLNRRFPL